MTMSYRILIGKKLTPDETKHISNTILSIFHDIHAIYDKWNPQSELSLLNRLKKGEQKKISPALYQLLTLTDQVVKKTGGRFDPTIEPLQKLWKLKLQVGRTPSNTEINAITPSIGWDLVHFNDYVFYKDHDATELDLGGIAKGYGVDLLTEALLSLKTQDVFVEWGGEIRAHGNHPEGRPWTIYISRLSDKDPNHAIATLYLENQAIATSGDYVQNTTVNGTTYFHILNPKTLQPLQATGSSIASASVVASTCALADGLATAAMLFSTKEAAAAWFKSLEEEDRALSLWLVSRDQE